MFIFMRRGPQKREEPFQRLHLAFRPGSVRSLPAIVSPLIQVVGGSLPAVVQGRSAGALVKSLRKPYLGKMRGYPKIGTQIVLAFLWLALLGLLALVGVI